jgi:alkylhydroperoxidase/carboxymuconolactone decarboxylase family protein YurZ
MQSLIRGVDEETKSELPKSPHPVDPSYKKRGEAMFNKVYSNVSERVKNNISNSSPDLMEIILQDVYGRVLSDVTLLGEIETELVTIAVLVPLQVPAQVGFTSIDNNITRASIGNVADYNFIQLKGHVHGARNVGASDAQIEAAKAIGQCIVDMTTEH